MAEKSTITLSRGNIFADLGFENSQNHHAKAQLIILIQKIIEAKNLTRRQAASKMGLRRPDVAKLLRGRFEGFSLDRLLKFVRALESDVKIKPGKSDHEGRILVTTREQPAQPGQACRLGCRITSATTAVASLTPSVPDQQAAVPRKGL
jgi:predicted XRE-type DNA-binding protein